MLHLYHSKTIQVLLLAAGAASLLPAATVCVNPAGSGGCLKTIVAAVAAANLGDTISVGPGTYKENVVIGKPLFLIGGDPATTIIDATGLPNAIYINGLDNKDLAGVVVSGFTLKNAKFQGLLATNASDLLITNNIVTGNDTALTFGPQGPSCPGLPDFEAGGEGFDCGEGVNLMGVHHSMVSNNSIVGNAGGILLSDDTGATHDNTLAGNTVSDNPFDCGITLASHGPAAVSGSKIPFGVYQNVIVGNTAARNGLKGEGAGVGIFASSPGTGAYRNAVVNNTLTGNNLPGVTIHGHTPNQILHGNVVIGNTISGNGPDTDEAATPGTAGIAFTSVSPIFGTVITGNTITGQDIGVAWNTLGEAGVTRNSFTRGSVGVYNLGNGTVSAENNWWGCNAGPTGLGSFAGCATVRGAVTVNSVSATPFK